MLSPHPFTVLVPFPFVNGSSTELQQLGSGATAKHTSIRDRTFIQNNKQTNAEDACRRRRRCLSICTHNRFRVWRSSRTLALEIVPGKVCCATTNHQCAARASSTVIKVLLLVKFVRTAAAYNANEWRSHKCHQLAQFGE